MGVEIEFKDINREPPPRAFLERHVAADHLEDFISKRSPALKNRPLPRTQREAIDLMLEQPNLIKRPVLVAGDEVVFGFDEERYRQLFK